MVTLNREEAELNQGISLLHQEVWQAVASISSQLIANEDRRALQARVQADMARLRAKTRDLELLAEEQET